MGKNTSLYIGDHFEEFMSKEIRTGRYKSVSEIVRAGLRLLENEEQKLEALRNALAEGENSGIIDNFTSKKHLKELHKKYKA
ncbi:MAG: type II toxin-antitoxin system ParD family antitoxin [Candidatus Delongbacteria bacterium]|jgi:antitoxin ParD1/3/4|nr:type II toxin-antitoxin system ParD family antitoxin [Candidatus Delongbacteria bacterium]